MKTKILKTVIFLTFVLLSNVVSSQNYASALGAIGGYSPDGYGGLINYNYYVNNNDFFQGSLFASFAIDEQKGFEIPYNTFTFQAGYFTPLFTTDRNNLKLNVGGGLVAGYEIINNGNNLLSNGGIILSKSQFVYGGFGSAELDIYLAEEWSLILKYNQYYHLNSDLGQFTLFAGAGFRYFLF